jgi:hypothetical protein
VGDRAEDRVTQVEAALLAQEHRPIHVLRNFFIRRKSYEEGAVARLFTPASPVFASAVGVAAIVVSLITVATLERQNLLISSQRELGTHTMLIDHNADLLRLLVQHPELRPYFYENVPLPTSGDDRARALTMAEMWTDLFEQVVIQSEHLPPEMAPTWRQYAKDMYGSSSAIHAYFAESRDWYVTELQDLWHEAE